MQSKVAKSLAPDFADPKRKPADTVVKVDFQAGNRIWANVGAEHMRFDGKMKDADLAQAIAGARERLGDKWHVTGTKEFQLQVARVVGEQEQGFEGVTFRHAKLNTELEQSRGRASQSRASATAAEAAAEQPKVAVNAELAATDDSADSTVDGAPEAETGTMLRGEGPSVSAETQVAELEPTSDSGEKPDARHLPQPNFTPAAAPASESATPRGSRGRAWR
jgi:hypothetical protein